MAKIVTEEKQNGVLIGRRGLITGLIALAAAPAIVRASSLMPVKVMRPWAGRPAATVIAFSRAPGTPELIITDTKGLDVYVGGHRLQAGDLQPGRTYNVVLEGGAWHLVAQVDPV